MADERRMWFYAKETKIIEKRRKGIGLRPCNVEI